MASHRASAGSTRTAVKPQPLCHLSTAGTELGQTRDSALGSLAADPGPEWVRVRFPAQLSDEWWAVGEPITLPFPPGLTKSAEETTWMPRPCVGRTLARVVPVRVVTTTPT